MPSSTVRTFTDPDAYAASIRGTYAQLTILGRGPFNGKLIQIELHHMQMRQAFDNLPRIGHGTDVAGQATISFRTEPGPSLIRSGVELLSSNLIRHSHAESYFQVSEGLACISSLSLPVEEMVFIGAANAGRDLSPPKDALSVTPPPAAMARLRQLHAAVSQLAEHAPAVISYPEAARSLEQALIEAMVGCVSEREPGEDRAVLRHHAAIMRRFYRIVEENPHQALFIPELCRAIGASERTLRVCCQEHLGLSPKRYLLLRRMHLVHGVLHDSGPAATTVTEIATRYGFWQFGRFAGEYKALFGELPSETLAQLHN
jgi:AraC-like DNA-binding protein